MANFFKDVVNDLDNVEQELLGPDYNYWKNIKSPSDLGMSSDGGLDNLANDISGLVSYVELLVSGSGNASVTGKALGNKFFLKTGAKCKVKSGGSDNGEIVDRYVYVNNVPDGEIPFISSGLGGTTFTEFEGLIPGTMSDAAQINPFGLFKAFMMGNTPECQSVTLETIDANNNSSQQTNYVATADLSSMPAAWFPNKVNPYSGQKAIEAFTQRTAQIPEGKLSLAYYGSLGLLGLAILYGLTRKANRM